MSSSFIRSGFIELISTISPETMKLKLAVEPFQREAHIFQGGSYFCNTVRKQDDFVAVEW